MGYKKYTIKDVQNYLEEKDINHICTLLSTTYTKESEKLELRCNICGETFQRSFSNIKRNEKFCCSRCARGRNLKIQDVKDFLLKHDLNHECELLSTNYINYNTPLHFRCNICGETFDRKMSQVKTIQNYCCTRCGKRKGGLKNAFTILDVQQYLKENDLNHECELVSTTYINNNTPLVFKCNKCGNNFTRTLGTMKSKNAFSCFRCAHNLPLEETSSIYKYNVNFFRYKLSRWKEEYLKQYSQCNITSSKDNLEVHHLVNFHILLDQACENTNILLTDKVSNLPQQDVERLIDELIRLHETTEAVVLTREMHQCFHKQYGYKNNTPEQYYTFKNKCQEA